ncbi:hypothetical protein Cgig2_032876 [Carnegiea gigantea]|uniref:Ubiquitin-like protease family profile domain-containing protein n=1 Tax=Carnegiea gigantea TaxID=171969 RepID=A0A9Q1JN04_9CARY|nr:hypothetical protein Cgig2_032876 [Carnegiea gigantea]
MNFAYMYLVVCVLEMCYSWLRIMQVLASYISAPLSVTEIELVANIRSRFKGIRPNVKHVSLRLTCALTLTDREADLQECLLKLVPARWLWGLIHVVRKTGAGDSFKATPQPDVYYVFKPLLETSDEHWLLLVADLSKRSFIVYDSLPSPVTKSRQELVDSVSMGTTSLTLLTMFTRVKRITFVLAFLCSTTHADARQWHVITPNYPEQRNGHDCRVFVMAFMDLLSLKAVGFKFDQDWPGSSCPATSARFVSNFSNLVTHPKSGT